MYFNSLKKQSLQLIVLVMLPTLQSCSDFLKGKPKTQDVIALKTQEVECMKSVKITFQKLFNSETSEAEIDQSFQCLQNTLTLFQKNAEGRKNPDVFMTEELFTVFNKFFKDAQISQKATDDILIFKKALFGGEANSITKDELESVKNYLKIINVEVKKMSSYVPLFKFDKKLNVYDSITIQKAFRQLNNSMKTLINAVKVNQSAYVMTDLKSLIANLNILASADDQIKMNTLENLINLVAGRTQIRTNEEFAKVIDSLTSLGELYAQVVYTDLKFELSTSEQTEKILIFIEKLIQALEKTPQFLEEQKIELKYLDPIVSQIIKNESFPFKVSESTFIQFYKTILIRVFSDQKMNVIEDMKEINEVVLKNIKREIYIYWEYQRFINSVQFNTNNQISIMQFQQLALKYDFHKLKHGFIDQKFADQVLKGLYELRDESLSEFSVIFQNNKMVLSKDQNKSNVGWLDLSNALYSKMLARELILGWGVLSPDFDLKKSYINEQGMVSWYNDFKKFGDEVKLFDRRETNSGAKSFLEANLFTYYGNGDQQLNMYETFQYVSMLLAGGGEISKIITKDMLDAGCALNQNDRDVFGQPWLEEKCFVKQFRQKVDYYFSNVPNYSNFIKSLSEVEFKSYYDDLMVVARNDSAQVGRIETADIRAIVMLVMYIESVFGRYDTRDQFQLLNAAEIRQAYPRFRSFVTDFAKNQAKDTLEQWSSVINHCGWYYSQDELFREAFIFMVYNGRLPALRDMNYITCAFNGLFNFEGEVDRKKIISTFKVLKSVLASKK